MILETEVFRFDPDVTGVACSGRFTLGNRLSEAEALINSLMNEGVRKLVLDLTHVEFVDSAGLGVILRLFGEMEQKGGHMRVAGAREQVLRLFQITHAASILATDPDLVTSVKKLQEDQAAASG